MNLRLLENGLVPISETSSGERVVDARKLHNKLGVGRDFTTWIKDRIARYGFVENEDYMVFTNSGENLKGGRPRLEYIVTLDMAKELAMVENNEMGMKIRRYFIEVERRFRQQQTPRTIEDLIIMQAQSVKELKEQVAHQQQALEMVSHRVDTLDLTNIEGDARQRLSAMIRKYAFSQGVNFSTAWKHFDQSFNFAYRRNIGLMITHHANRLGKPTSKVTRPEVLEAYGMLEDALRVADKMLNRAS